MTNERIRRTLDLDDYLTLSDVSCVNSRGRIFESHPILYVAKILDLNEELLSEQARIVRNSKGEDTSKKRNIRAPLLMDISQAHSNMKHLFPHDCSFVPSLPLVLNSLLNVYDDIVSIKQKIERYKREKKHTENLEGTLLTLKKAFDTILHDDKEHPRYLTDTVIDYNQGRIVHYGHGVDLTCPDHPGSRNGKKRVEYKFNPRILFDSNILSNSFIEDILAEPNLRDFFVNLTGIQDFHRLGELCEYSQKTFNFWLPYNLPREKHIAQVFLFAGKHTFDIEADYSAEEGYVRRYKPIRSNHLK